MIQPERSKRFKRGFRKRRRQVVESAGEANRQLDKHVFKRIDNLQYSWRFVFSWIALLAVLVGGVGIQTRALGRYHIGTAPVAGGEYVEGIEGSFSNVSPIFAASPVDTSLSKLLFSGLLKYDDNGKLVGDLAESWTSDNLGTTYTVVLRPRLEWHDGVDITAEDVVYTIEAIQNPDSRSPYNLNWQGVTVKATDDRTIVITLPNALTSFAHSLTLGILPKHILGKLPYAQLRSDQFNTRAPVGSGPFVWNTLLSLPGDGDTLRQRVTLRAYEDYHLGRPKLDRYTIETFSSQGSVVDALRAGKINGATLSSLQDVDGDTKRALNQTNVPLLSGVYLFFNTQKAPFNDKPVRNAFAKIVDRSDLRAQLDYAVISVEGPFLRSHQTYDETRLQVPQNLDEAAKTLDAAGWVKPTNSFVRQKDQKALEFTLLSEQNSEYARLADVLQRQFADMGIKLNIDLRSGREFQQALVTHQYDALLYGISIGSDPDVFAYWHSSQAVVERFNFSEYKSPIADEALESGRTRLDDQLRAVKYRPFLDAWRDDTPAVGLYQPRLLFVANGALYHFDVKTVATSSDRYVNVHNWMINTEQVSLESK